MRTLEENEAIIAAGLKSFIAMGEALKEIRDNRQYEKVYGKRIGWASYLHERWNMTKQFAGQLILASEAVVRLKRETIVSVLPDKEAQVRELRKAPVAQQPVIWEEAVKEAEKKGRKQPTAKEISEKVAEKKKVKREEKKEKEEQRIEIGKAVREGEVELVWEKIRWDVEPFIEALFSKLDPEEIVDASIAIDRYIYKTYISPKASEDGGEAVTS